MSQSVDNELKWLKRGSWKYIPERYQALVACIVSGFLYFNIFELVFSNTSDNGACGSVLRPTLDDQFSPSWIWSASPWRMNEDLVCPRHIYLSYWELIASFFGLAICGVVLRRAIRREREEKANPQ